MPFVDFPPVIIFLFEVHDVDPGGISAKKIKMEVREKNHRNHEDMQDSIGEIAKKAAFRTLQKSGFPDNQSISFQQMQNFTAPRFITMRCRRSTRSLMSQVRLRSWITMVFWRGKFSGHLRFLDPASLVLWEVRLPVLPGNTGDTLQAPVPLFLISC